MKAFCNSRAVQVLAFLASYAFVWYSLPGWLAPMDILWHALLTWLAGACVFLFVMMCIYSIECALTPGAK